METPLQLYGGCVSRQEMFCRADLPSGEAIVDHSFLRLTAASVIGSFRALFVR